MKNKWSSKKVKSTQDWLSSRWPELFAWRPDQKPLSLSIHKDILKHRAENPELSSRSLSEALKRHVTSYGYLFGMQKNAHRYDLEGNKVDSVSATHRKWARSKLRLKQRLAQKVRKERLTRLNTKTSRKTLQKHVPVRMDFAGESGAKRAAPVIRYNTSRKKLIKREVDLAS